MLLIMIVWIFAMVFTGIFVYCAKSDNYDFAFAFGGISAVIAIASWVSSFSLRKWKKMQPWQQGKKLIIL